MAQYNVTRDIQKLAEEAERSKTQDLTLAGLGLGGGFVASQTGGSAKNPNTKLTPLQQQIAENDARNRQNARNQGRTKTSTPKPQPQPEFKIDRRTKAGQKVVQEVVDQFGGNKPPVVKDDPLPNTSRKTIKTKPEVQPKVKTKAPLFPEFKGMPTGSDFKTFSPKKQVGNVFRAGGSLARGAFDPRTFALMGGFEAGNLIGLDEAGEALGEVIGENLMTEDRLGLANFYANITGGTDPRRPSRFVKTLNFLGDAYNTAVDVAGNVLEGTARLVPETADYVFSSNPQTDNVFKSAYGKAFDDDGTYLGLENERRPNPEMSGEAVAKNFETGDVKSTEDVLPESPAIPLSDRSQLEQQIIRNQQGGQPLLAGTFKDQQMNQAFGGEGVPTYQANFLERKQQEEPITDAEFQRAQQFALKRGMVFDPETGYSKADFFGQMFKGQTIGQFLRGEDAPEGFTDVIGQTADPREEARKSFEQASREREQRIADRPDFMEAVPDEPEGELSLSDYRNLARAKGFKGSAQITEAKRLMKEDQSKDELTPYQKETLERADISADLAERKFKQSVKEYKEGVERGLKGEELDNLYRTVQILGLLNDIKGKKEELGFDFQSKDLTDYVSLLDELGVDFDPETSIYRRKGKFGFGGKQLTKEELAELSPLLEQTKFIKLLKYTSENNQ